MNKTLQKQAAKGKAFNSIKRIYHPKSNFTVSEFPRDESYSEKVEYEVSRIMQNYFKELDEINKRELDTNTKRVKIEIYINEDNLKVLDALSSSDNKSKESYCEDMINRKIKDFMELYLLSKRVLNEK